MPGKDWFLRDWLIELKKKQAWIARDLGWERGRVSKLYNGKQDYTRADVNQLSDWLKIEPFELLMPPREALALRRIRETAAAIVAEADARQDGTLARANASSTYSARPSAGAR